MIVTEILQGCLLEYMHKIDPIPDENGSHRCDLDFMKLERLSHLTAQDVQGKDIECCTVDVSASSNPIESADRSVRSGAIDS